MPKPISSSSSLETVVAESSSANESTPRRPRRKFTASQKLRFVQAADAAIASGERGALQALFRREGLYSSHLASWRRQLAEGGNAGLAEKKRGRKPAMEPHERELVALKKRNAALERKLEIAEAVIELQKKAHAVLGLALPNSDEEI